MKFNYTASENKPAFVLVEPGDYVGTVTSYEEGYTKRNGDPKIEVKFKLDAGALIWENFTITEKAKWKCETFIQCVGVPAQDGGEVELSEDIVVGRRGIVKVGVDEYIKNGQEYKKNVIDVWYTDKEKFPPKPGSPAANKNAIEILDPDDDEGEEEPF